MRLPVPGDLFLDRYKLTDLLGRGGFAMVFKAIDVRVSRTVAIKFQVPEGNEHDERTIKRFMREAKLLGGLHDAHTVVMYDFGTTEDGLLYMVCEYLGGHDLVDHLEDYGPLSEYQAESLLRQLLQALRAAHHAGIMHRDVKPANVMVQMGPSGELQGKLIDFGIAKPTMKRTDISTITATGLITGTPRYMSPEQMCGEPLTPASDLYSLGLVMYEAVTGRPAIEGDDTFQIMKGQLSEEPIRLPPELPISPRFAAVLERMVARSVHRRYPDSEAVFRDLDLLDEPQQFERVAAAGLPATTSGPTPVSPLVTVALVAVFTIVFGGLVMLLAGDDDEQARVSADVSQAPRAASPPPVPAQPASTDVPSPGAVGAAPPEVDGGRGAVDAGRDEGAEVDALGSIGACAEEARAGIRRKNVVVAGVNREYRYYVPRSYEVGRQHPIVVGIDARWLDGGENPLLYELQEAAEAGRFVLLAPMSFDPDLKFKHRTDERLLETALEDLAKELCVNPRRIYGVGHAGSAGFLKRLACRREFSGIVISAARLSRNDRPCRPEDPPPMLSFHADRDPYEPLDGGAPCKGSPKLSADEHDEIFRDVNGCGEASSAELSRREDGVCTVWEGCDAPYARCIVRGGHYWPLAGATTFHINPRCTSPGTKFPYGAQTWEFFEQYGRDIPEDAWID